MSEKLVVAGLVNKTSAKPSPREPPRLRIHHLLLWMAITAAWLVVMRLLHSSRVEHVVLLFLQLTNGLELGAATTIGLLGILWKLRGLRFFNQPGQWLAIVPALEAAFAALAFFCGALLVRFVGEQHDWPMMVSSHGWPIAGVCLILAWAVAHTYLWRTFFIAVAVLTLLPFYMWVSGVRIIFARAEVFAVWWIPTCILVLASILDARQRHCQRLHWTHWAGFGIWLFGVLAGQAAAILHMPPAWS